MATLHTQVPGGGKHMLKNHGRRGLWISNLLLVGGLVLVAVFATLYENLAGPAAVPEVRLAVSVLVALLPPLLWLLLFYGLDRVEPEPKEHILKMAFLGALVQAAVHAPLTELLPVLGTANALPSSSQSLFGILIASALRESLKLMTLRYGMMRHESFNEKTDGILYGSAIGLGFSATMNLTYAFQTGGALLSAAAPQMVITSLIQASLGGLGGYWLGLSVFKKQARWCLPVNLLVLVGLSSGLQILTGLFVRQGFRVNYLTGLIPSALAALGIFLVLILLMRRHGPAADASADRVTRYDGRVLTILATGTMIGAVMLQGWSTRLLPAVPFPGVTMSVPSGWQTVREEGAAYASGARYAGSGNAGYVHAMTFESSMPDENAATEGEAAIYGLAARWTIRASRETAWYNPIRTEFLYRDGRWIAVMEAYRLDTGVGEAKTGQPVVREWRDVLWSEGGSVFVISLYGMDAKGDADQRLMDGMVASVRFERILQEEGGAE